MQKIYVTAIWLNIIFVAVEVSVGLVGNSLGLIADAGHNLSDVFSLVLALIAVKLALTHGTKRFTYGYRKSSVLIALLNAIILLVAVGAIILESIERIYEICTESVDVMNSFNNGALISWTAGVGILVNGVTTWMLHSHQHDINAKAAYLHMLSDTLVSVGVVASGLIIAFTSLSIIDPIISLAISVIILVSTCKLLGESIRMSIDAVPEGINPEEIKGVIESVEGVSDVHHIHIWAISTTETALTAHVTIADKQQLEKITESIKKSLKLHGIAHSTLEMETSQSICHDRECNREPGNALEIL